MKKVFFLSVVSLVLTMPANAQNVRGEQVRNNSVAYNVKDFGATGNGSTNDYSSILSAINRSNAVVTFPSGTYLINSTLVLNSVSNLRITGNSGATIEGGGTPTNLHQLILLTGTCTNVEIDGIDFTSLATDSTSVDSYGLLTDTGSFTSLYIHNCSFSSPHCQTNGIKIICQNANTGSDINIQNCSFTNVGRMGVEFQNQTDTTARINNAQVSKNYFNNLGLQSQFGMAVSMSGAGYGAVIEGNIVVDPLDVGIESAGWRDVTISNNTIRSQRARDTSYTGISVSNSGVTPPATPLRTSIIGNTIDITGNTNFAIQVTNLSQGTIAGNVTRSGGTGIGLFESYDCVITGNSIIGGASTTLGHGSGLLFTGSSNNTASGNLMDITQNPTYAICVYYNANGSTLSTNNTVAPDNVIRLNSTGIAFQQAADGSNNNTLSLGDDPITVANNANYTITRSKVYIILPVISANYTVTVPNPASYPGQNIYVQDANTSGSNWAFTTTYPVVTAAGATIGNLTNSTVYQLKSNGSSWVKMN